MATFYRLLGFLRPYRRGLTVSWILASLAMVMTVALPALTGRAVEAISDGAHHAEHHQPALRAHDRNTLLTLALVILALVLLRWGPCTGGGWSPGGCRWASNTTCASGSTAICSAWSSASSTTSRPAS